MKKIIQGLLLALGISSEACAPPNWADFPNQDEQVTMDEQSVKLKEATPWGQQIIRYSNVDFVDLEGNPCSPEELAEQLPQVPELLSWFISGGRSLVADTEDFPDYKKDGTDVGGLYQTRWLQEENNDWFVMDRDNLEDTYMYGHEMCHKWSPWHTDKMITFLDNEEELYSQGSEQTRLSVALSSGDPCYIVGQTYVPAVDLDEVTKEFLAKDLSEDIIYWGQRYIEERGYTPQQAYDYLYKDNTLRTFNDIDWEIAASHYDNNVEYYEALKIDKNRFTEMFLNHEPFMKEYKERLLNALDAFAEMYPDNEITTIREREEGEDYPEYQERRVTDLDGYRSPNQRRLR